jgi:hypothetical protein
VPTALLADALGLRMEEVLERIDSVVVHRDRAASPKPESIATPVRAP